MALTVRAEVSAAAHSVAHVGHRLRLVPSVKFLLRGVHRILSPRCLRVAVGATRLLPVPRIHPTVQLVAMEPDGHTGPGGSEAPGLHCPPDRGALDVAVPGCLLVS